MPQPDLFKELTSPEIYNQVFGYLQQRLNKDPELGRRAPVEKSISLQWCLREQEMITGYLINSIKKKSYKPGISHRYTLSVDKQRIILGSNWIDKIFEYALCTLLFQFFHDKFCPDLYSYRKGFSNRQSLLKFQTYLRGQQNQPLYIAKFDIKSYTDSINVNLFAEQLKSALGSQNDFIWELVKKITSPEYINKSPDLENSVATGVATGTYFSTFAANFYLMEVDALIFDKIELYSRYGDDLLLVDRNINRLEDAVLLLKQNLILKELELNHEKTRQIVFSGPSIGDYKAASRIKHLGFSVYSTGEIFLEGKKLLKTKKQIEQHLYQACKTVAGLHVSADDKLIRLIHANNFLIKKFFLVRYLPDLVRFCDHKTKMQNLDRWIATKIISLAYPVSKRCAFRKVSYRKLHELGLLSISNLKNLYSRKDEVFRHFSSE